MPQYSGVWNLAQQAQALTSQQWVTDPNFKNTTLLLQADNAANSAQNNTFLDSSTNAFAITRNGNTTQGSFTPFSQSAGWWSNYFGGSGNYAVSNAAVFTNTTTTFTIEGWIYPTAAAVSTTGSAPSIIGDITPAAGTCYWVFGTLPSGAVMFYWFDGAAKNATTTGTVTLNQWSHIAISVNANAITIYINGIQQTLTGTTTLTNRSGTTSTVAFGQWNSAAYLYTGYLSNFSVLSGTAKYSGSFTPSPLPLATGTTNQVLLFGYGNNFADSNTATTAKTFTLTGTPSVQAFSPFAPQYQWTPTVIGGSGYFNGTTDYLTVADNAALEPGTSNFTLECWFYSTANPPANGAVILSKSATSSFGPFAILIDPSTKYINGLASTTGSSWNISIASTTVAVLNTWYHVALVRSGSNFALFINGTRAATASSAGTLINNTDPFAVGYANYTSTYFTGYISNVRYVVGTALYDPTLSTCTVPTAPLTAVTNTQALINFTNAGIYDGTMKNDFQTVGNAQVSTSVVKYGSGSMYFPASGNGLQFPSNVLFTMGTGDFTIETWAYVTDLSTYRGVFQISSTSGGYSSTLTTSLGMDIRPSNAGFEIYAKGTSNAVNYSVSTNTWYHLALVRLNGITTFYVNGVSQATYTADTTSYAGPYLGIGNIYNGSYPFSGYIDEFRITRGLARYTRNFTPPQVALPRQ